MILRRLVFKTIFKKCLRYPDKFACVTYCGKTNKSIHQVIEISNNANFSTCSIPYKQYLPHTTIVRSLCHVISKRHFSSNHFKSKLRKDDDLQPEIKVKEIPLEEGEFSLSPTHFDRKIQNKDIGRKFTVGENVITALNNVYGIERRIALSMMRSQKFLLIADSTILQTLYFLAKKNISPEQIQRIPWLLLYENEILQGKMDLLVQPHLFETIEDGLGFCYLPKQRIHNTNMFFTFEANKFPNHRNRLYCMAEMLEVPTVAHLTERIVKPNRIMAMDFKRIVDLLDLLKRHNVSNDDILRDLWIFFHNVSTTEIRLKKMIEAGCTRPRLWMCRCKDDVFEKSVQHYEERKLILGDRMSVVEYLAEQFECSPEEVETHCATNPNLIRVRVSKLQSIMELLLAEGITREAIRASPRILQHSEIKLRNRIHRLKELGYQPTTCPTLFKSQTKFETFCKNLKENNFIMERSTRDNSSGGIKDPWISSPEASPFSGSRRPGPHLDDR